MKFIIGKKIEMTQVWQSDDKVTAVTKIQAGPCKVVQLKNNEKDGYEAVQIGYGERKEKNIKKPQKNHTKGLGNIRYLREFRTSTENLKRGDIIDVSSFEVGDVVNATGTSKGRGFQGVVKRHGFKGTKASHGNKDQLRMPGSIGATGPAHVFKGTRMGGRMGGDRVTLTNLEVVEIDKENNIISIKGAIPGARNGLVLIKGKGELKVITPKIESKSDLPKADQPKVEKQEKKDEEVKESNKEDKQVTSNK